MCCQFCTGARLVYEPFPPSLLRAATQGLVLCVFLLIMVFLHEVCHPSLCNHWGGAQLDKDINCSIVYIRCCLNFGLYTVAEKHQELTPPSAPIHLTHLKQHQQQQQQQQEKPPKQLSEHQKHCVHHLHYLQPPFCAHKQPPVCIPAAASRNHDHKRHTRPSLPFSS